MDKIPPLFFNLIITEKNGKPALEIRKVTTEPELIKIILENAFNDKPVIAYPVFTNRLKAISVLVDKGIIYKETDKFYYNI